MSEETDRLRAVLAAVAVELEDQAFLDGKASRAAEVADLQLRLDTAEAALSAAVAHNVVDDATIDSLSHQVTALTQQVEDLTQRLHDCENPPPPPPPPPPPTGWDRMLLGANDSDWADLDTKIRALGGGKHLQVRRFYDGTFPNAPSPRMVEDWARGVAPWVSFSGPSIATINSGSHDSTIAAFFKACTKKAIVTFIHEVDNGKGTAAEYVKALRRIGAIKRANCPANDLVLFGPCYMAYTFQTGAGGPWLPADAGTFIDVLGADPYRYWRPAHSPDLTTPCPDAGGTKRSMEYLMGPMPALARLAQVPLALGEYGAHPDPADKTDRPGWLNDTHAWLRANNCVAACYFNAPYGGRGPWFLTEFHKFAADVPSRHSGIPDPDSIKAFAADIQ